MNFLRNSNNTCKLQLANNDAHYLAGQSIEGQVQIDLQSNLQCRGIKVKLQCTENTFFNDTESYHDESGNQKSRFTQFTGENEIFSNLLWLYGEQNGSHTLSAGMRSYPFVFHLPANIPGTSEFDCGRIVYKIIATIDVPLARDYDDYAIIYVKSPIDLNFSATVDDLRPSFYSDEKTVGCCCCAQGEITMEIELPRRTLIPNEEMAVLFKLTNMSNTNVSRVGLELQQILTFKATEPSKSEKDLTNIIIKMDQVGVGAHGDNVFTFKVDLPGNLPLPNFVQSTLMRVRYQYKATVFLPCPHRNMVLNVPILIGDIPLGQQGNFEAPGKLGNPQSTGSNIIGWSNPAASGGFNPSAPPIDNSNRSEEPPPSYETLKI